MVPWFNGTICPRFESSVIFGWIESVALTRPSLRPDLGTVNK